MKDKGVVLYIVWLAFLVAIAIGLIVGWVLNVVTLYNAPPELTWSLVVRVIGVFVAPLGAILGWL